MNSVVSAAIIEGNLIIGLSDGSIINCGFVQGPQGLSGPQGPMGATGDSGTDGNTIITVAGTPGNEMGSDGDYAIDNINWRIYGPKSGGVWGKAKEMLPGPENILENGRAPSGGSGGGSMGGSGSGGGGGTVYTNTVQLTNSTRTSLSTKASYKVLPHPGVGRITQEDANLWAFGEVFDKLDEVLPVFVGPNEPTDDVYTGRLWFDTDDDTLYIYDGNLWEPVSGSGGGGGISGLETVNDYWTFVQSNPQAGQWRFKDNSDAYDGGIEIEIHKEAKDGTEYGIEAFKVDNTIRIYNVDNVGAPVGNGELYAHLTAATVDSPSTYKLTYTIDDAELTAVGETHIVVAGAIRLKDLDDRYVNTTGGDSMQGPLQITGGRNVDANGNEGTLKALNIDSGQNSSLNLKWNGQTKVYLGEDQAAFQGNIKFNQGGRSIYAGNDKKGFTVNDAGVFYEGDYRVDKHIVTKKNLEEAIYTDPTDLDSNVYLKRDGDTMTGQLEMLDGKGIKFTGLGNTSNAVVVDRSVGEFPVIMKLNHPGGQTQGGYEIAIGGNTSYNELRINGGSSANDPMVTFKANGNINFWNNVRFNNHNLHNVADGTSQTDAVNLRQLQGSAADLQFNINLNASTQKSIRAGLDDLVATSVQVVSEDPTFKNSDTFENAYAMFPGKDDYHHQHVDQRFILLSRMYEGSKKTDKDGNDVGNNNETLDSNAYGNDGKPNLALQDLRTGKFFPITAATVSDDAGTGSLFPTMRGCHIVTNDDGSCNAYLWVHNPLRTVRQSGFGNEACPLFRIFIPAEADVDDANPFDNFIFKWTNIRCPKSNFTTPAQNPYQSDRSKSYQYEIQTETFYLRDKRNNRRYFFMSYNKGSSDKVTHRMFEATISATNPDNGSITPVEAHADSDNGVYCAGMPAIKKTTDGGTKCFLWGHPTALTELYFVPDGSGEKVQLRNYQDYTPEGTKIVDPNGAVNDIGHPIIVGKGIYDNWYKLMASQPQWLTEGLWDENNPFSTKLVYFQGGYGIVSIPTEDIGNKADEVRLENNFKGDINSMHLEHVNTNYLGYNQGASQKNLTRFSTSLIDTRSNGSVWFFDYKPDYPNDKNDYYNDTREFDGSGNLTFKYEFKRGIIEVRPNVPDGTIEIIGHEIGRKRSDNGAEEGNTTDFSGEAICKMYDQFVCVAAAASHSSISKPRVHIFDPFTKVISLVSDTEVNATTAIPVPQRGLVALSDYGADVNGDPTTMYYVGMLADNTRPGSGSGGGGSVDLTPYFKRDASNGPITGNLEIDRTAGGTDQEASLVLKGRRPNATNSSATVAFQNHTNSTIGYLTYRASGTDGFFRFNRDVGFNSKSLLDVSRIDFNGPGILKVNNSNALTLRRAANGNDGNANFQIERAPNARRTFAVRGKDASNNETDILWGYANTTGPDAVNYNGKMDSGNNLVNLAKVQELIANNGGGGASGETFISHGPWHYAGVGATLSPGEWTTDNISVKQIRQLTFHNKDINGDDVTWSDLRAGEVITIVQQGDFTGIGGDVNGWAVVSYEVKEKQIFSSATIIDVSAHWTVLVFDSGLVQYNPSDLFGFLPDTDTYVLESQPATLNNVVHMAKKTSAGPAFNVYTLSSSTSEGLLGINTGQLINNGNLQTPTKFIFSTQDKYGNGHKWGANSVDCPGSIIEFYRKNQDGTLCLCKIYGFTSIIPNASNSKFEIRGLINKFSSSSGNSYIPSPGTYEAGADYLVRWQLNFDTTTFDAAVQAAVDEQLAPLIARITALENA